MRDYVLLYVNGIRHQVRGDAALMTLTDYLRYERRLTGTKVVCAEGDCGACTVLVGRPSPDAGWRFDAVNACIASVAQMDGTHLITIEGVADETGLHEVQRAMVDHHGSQCGFCTPGFVMALLVHFEQKPSERATEKAIKNRLTGNLCRCTGYQPIIDAGCDVRPERLRSVVGRHHNATIEAELSAVRLEPLRIQGDTGVFEGPTTVEQTLALRAKSPSARLISGNTDLGVLVNKGKLWPAGTQKHAIGLQLVSELERIEWEDDDNQITIGARATLDAVERACEVRVPEFAHLLHVFASPQIKAMCTLGGNVANGSPIGDTIPALFALGAELGIAGPAGPRWLPIEQFYKAYKVFDLAPDEILTAIRFRAPSEGCVFRAYKVCQRKDLDISYVGAAYHLEVEGGIVRAARVAYGGVAGTVIRLSEIEARLTGTAIGDETAWEALATAIEATVTPLSDVRGSLEGRRLLTGNLFRRFGHELRSGVAP